MKKYLNLLPPAEQQEFKSLRLTSRLRDFGIWLCLSLAVLIMFFVAIRFYLNGERDNSRDRLAAQKDLLNNIESSAFREDLARFNSELVDFQTLQAAQKDYSAVLMEIAEKIPKDLTLDRFTFDEKTGKIEIAGRGASRVSVLTFRSALMESSLFANINFPLANLEKPRNVAWEYRFYLKKNKVSQNEN